MTYLNAGLFKTSQKHFEYGYNFLSKKKAKTVMEEIVAKENRQEKILVDIKVKYGKRETTSSFQQIFREAYGSYLV